MSETRGAPVIIDTDPGLDDALALFLAFRSPELDVRGVVTVAGNIGIDHTTRNARALLRVAGREDVPVVRGAARPFAREPFHAPGIHGEDGLGGIDVPEPRAPEHPAAALDWLADEIDSHPAGAVRILALGPLTNVARLIVERPEQARLIGGVVAMGGAVRDRGNVTPHAEFNIAADPEAAAVVLASGVPVTLVPLDVTRQVAADEAWAERLAARGGALAALTRQLHGAYLDNIAALRASLGVAEAERRPHAFPLHDPCVILHAVRPELFHPERLRLRVVRDRSERDGATVIDPAGDAADVLTGADAPAALAFVADRLAG
ncbi:nucleoside hydrolase [Alsobacter sp. SYSU M60028]|uniref:Nucleoside hydrolase n=1 Tax=Alsobacter ponti TaxID=2962936 RepID=A0ABT1LCN9_9HYPH|nr:nucleoside hydrolase [Alsobacter ponti]MCP8938013.1 nucleoside hydrolase [Alsobacter ponti]